MGLGQKRPKPQKEGKQERKTKLGIEGEDVVKDESGQVTLVAPARFGLGTVKGAAYKVLQDVGPEGLTIAEIARRIQEQGLRDLSTSKTPEVALPIESLRDLHELTVLSWVESAWLLPVAEAQAISIFARQEHCNG